jgi:hypothetical protein
MNTTDALVFSGEDGESKLTQNRCKAITTDSAKVTADFFDTLFFIDNFLQVMKIMGIAGVESLKHMQCITIWIRFTRKIIDVHWNVKNNSS